MQRFNQKTSSDDGSQDEAPVHRPKQMAVQELQRRINRAAASHSSSPDEDQPCIAEDSNPENDHDSEDASDYPSDDAHEPDVSMGERVANLMHGPSIRTRRRSQVPISLPWSRGTSRHDDGKLSPNSGSKTDPSNVIKRRVNKHAPVEERIARRPVSVVRDAVQRKSVKSQDPRFIARNNPDNQREADIARRCRCCTMRRSPLLFDLIPVNQVCQICMKACTSFLCAWNHNVDQLSVKFLGWLHSRNILHVQSLSNASNAGDMSP